MVPGARLSFWPRLRCAAPCSQVLQICTPFSTRKRLAEVTIQVDVVGTRTTRSTLSFERRSSSTSRSRQEQRAQSLPNMKHQLFYMICQSEHSELY